mgnify:FL=1
MRTSQEKYFPIIEKFMSSGLTAKAFSERNRINKNTLSYWKKRYRDQSKVQQKGFTALSITQIQSKQISIEYADGTRLVFSDAVNAAVLRSLVPVFQP